tara:strand:- start:1948 stop:2085 length:138 start_codon:yes stop_codon:yes gene_type:complete
MNYLGKQLELDQMMWNTSELIDNVDFSLFWSIKVGIQADQIVDLL